MAIATLLIMTKDGNIVVLKKLPGNKPHLLYGNALEMEREPDSKFMRSVNLYFLKSYIYYRSTATCRPSPLSE